MELKTTHQTMGGETVEVFEGEIDPQDLCIGDEIQWPISDVVLVAEIIAETEEGREADFYWGLDRTIYLGKHVIRNAFNDRQSTSGRQCLRRPFSFGIDFTNRIKRQGIDVGNLDMTSVSRQPVKKGYPIVLRKTEL